MMKKIISLVLAVIMLVSVVPVAYAESNTYKVGDIIQFGTYPQSEVTDEALIAELNALAPEWDEWTSYGYYSGNGYDYTMTQGNYMRFFDLSYQGQKYRAVKFEEYRPRYTYGKASNNLQDDNDYYVNETYWFKYEALDWRILDTNTGLAMCETIIDSQPYSNTLYKRDSAIEGHQVFNDINCSNYGSDYVTSSIRQWLNADFYNSAFSLVEKDEIMTAVLDNLGYHSSRGTTGYEEFDGIQTEDKVFLLSYREVINSDYGFNSDSKNNDKARVVRERTDYAKCQGLNTAKVGTKWLLRSPGMSASTSCIVDVDGSSNGCQLDMCATGTGVRPAIKLSTIHQHNYAVEAIVPATCTTDGYTTFTCECGDSYIGEIVKATGHSYNTDTVQPTCKAAGYTLYTCECGDNYIDDLKDIVMHKDDDGDYRCDYGCGLFMSEEGMEASDPCDCNCHAGGIKAFFFKVLLFFQKFFGKNKVCACGEYHY